MKYKIISLINKSGEILAAISMKSEAYNDIINCELEMTLLKQFQYSELIKYKFKKKMLGKLIEKKLENRTNQQYKVTGYMAEIKNSILFKGRELNLFTSEYDLSLYFLISVYNYSNKSIIDATFLLTNKKQIDKEVINYLIH